MPASNRRDIPTSDQLQAQCDKWNKLHPEGSLVSYESIIHQGETYRGKSSSPAQVLSGNTAVIWLEGKTGCVSLDHCTVVDGSMQ